MNEEQKDKGKADRREVANAYIIEPNAEELIANRVPTV